MQEPIKASLVRYQTDGRFVAAAVTLEGAIVEDEIHGRVLEIILPAFDDPHAEAAILVPVSQLRRAKCAAVGAGPAAPDPVVKARWVRMLEWTAAALSHLSD
jgi:hypothetical protein